jgi:hypothetical protein
MTTELDKVLDQVEMPKTRLEWLEFLVDIDEHDGDNSASCHAELAAGGGARYLLDEVSARDDTCSYYTLHSSIEDACDYHYEQDYPGDWDVFSVWDLDTGKSVSEKYLAVVVQYEHDGTLGRAIVRYMREHGRPKGSDIDEWMKEMKG